MAYISPANALNAICEVAMPEDRKTKDPRREPTWGSLLDEDEEPIPDKVENEGSRPQDIIPASTGETPLRPGPPPPFKRELVITDVRTVDNTPAIGLKSVKSVSAHQSPEEQSAAEAAALKAAGLYRKAPDPDTTAPIELPREQAERMRAERQARLATEDPNSLRGRFLQVPGSPPSLGSHGNRVAGPPANEEVIPVPTREVIDLLPLQEPAPKEEAAPPDEEAAPPDESEKRLISYNAIRPPPSDKTDTVPMPSRPSFIGRIADFIRKKT